MAITDHATDFTKASGSWSYSCFKGRPDRPESSDFSLDPPSLTPPSSGILKQWKQITKSCQVGQSWPIMVNQHIKIPSKSDQNRLKSTWRRSGPTWLNDALSFCMMWNFPSYATVSGP